MKKVILIAIILNFPSLACSQSLSEEAAKAYSDKDWQKASLLYSELIKENHYDNFLPRIRFALSELYLENYDNAIKAFYDFDRLNNKWKNVPTNQDWRVAYGLAYAFRGKEDVDSSAFWYNRLVDLNVEMIDNLRNDADLKTFLGDSYFEEITGIGEQNLDRDARWQKDLDFLKRTLLGSHYNPFINYDIEVWEETYEDIRSKIPILNDKLLAMEFSRLAALTDGHTYSWPMASSIQGYQMLPLVTYIFSDGYFIVATSETHKQYAGHQVLKIGEMQIEEVVKKASGYGTGYDNSMHEKNVAPYYVSTVETLQLIGAIDNTERIPVTLAKDDKIIEVEFAPIPWAYERFHTKFPLADNWFRLHDRGEKALWQKNQENNYWFQYVENKNMVYFGFNNIINKPDDQSIEEFSEELFQFIEDKKVENLVMDLRNNNGGSTNLYRPLLLQIMNSRISEEGKFFTIIGRATFSAAVNFVSDLEYWTNTIFIGEPASSGTNFIGEEKYFSLPYSKIQVSVSDRLHQGGAGSSADRRIWIAPDVATSLSSSDFKNGIDPAMNWILSQIK